MAGVPVRRGGTWNQQGVDGIEGGGQVSEEQTRRGRRQGRGTGGVRAAPVRSRAAELMEFFRRSVRGTAGHPERCEAEPSIEGVPST